MRIWRTIVVGVIGVPLAGCYMLVPAGGLVPEVGTEVAFDINDAGRVGLGGSMGPEIGQLEGRLVQKDSGSYLLAVSVVQLLRGGEQVWRGENVRIRKDFVSAYYERQFSTGRSIALGVVGAAVVAYLASRSLLGAGAPNVPSPSDTLGSAIRIPRP